MKITIEIKSEVVDQAAAEKIVAELRMVLSRHTNSVLIDLITDKDIDVFLQNN